MRICASLVFFRIFPGDARNRVDKGESYVYNMKSKLKMDFKMEDQMKKIIALTAVCLAVMLGGFAMAEELQIVTTSFPCYDFARQVAGENAQVTMLIRPGTEVHAYEPTPADILTIGGADLFIYIGGESDVWADDILASFGGDAPQCVRLMESVEALEEEHAEAEAHDHGELELDEHIWTSPKNAVQMVRAVESALCAARPEAAEEFHANAEVYAGEIEQIDQALEQIAANGARRELVFADRFPFLYMAHDYGLSYCAAFSSCTTDTEPSAQTMVKLIETIQKDGIPVVYTIEMSTGAIARTLAEETGVEVLELHSVQTVRQSEFDAGETYVSLMWKNLAAIEKGLN